MKFVCSEKGKKSRVHFPACCYTAKTRPKARKENIMPDQNHIVIQGLCQNNLKNISLKIPKQKLVVFTGVSGSGKSSIVFDTIAAESQRQMNETYSAYVRGRLPKYEKPKAERIENLSPPRSSLTRTPLGATPVPRWGPSATCIPPCGCSTPGSGNPMWEHPPAFPSTIWGACVRSVPDWGR